jgi:hypothetical protein
MINLEDRQILTEAVEDVILDTLPFAETFWPREEGEYQSDLFELPFASMHREIFSAMDNETPKVLRLAPRGSGKTSCIRAYAIRKILARDCRFVLYVSATLGHAEMQTENIKAELLSNQLILKTFGKPTVVDADLNEVDSDSPNITSKELRESFSKKSWVAFGHTIIVPKGSGQQVRGLNWRGHRPDLIIIDDLEDDESVLSEDQRKKRIQWLLGSLFKCINRRKRHKIIYIDTLKHEDAAPIKLRQLPDWDYKLYSICDDKYNSLMPDFMTTEEVLAEVESYTLAGELDVFYREMMNIPIAPGTAAFQVKYFKYYNEEDLKAIPDLESVVIVDPARTTTPQSDDSAIVGVGIDVRGRSIYIRDIDAGKFYPDDMYAKAVEMCKRIGARVIGIEVTGLNEFITYPFYNYMHTHGIYNLEVVELKPRQKKEDRITALIPLYRSGHVFHNRTCCVPLEVQLLSFPRAARDDIMDALAYIAEMFKEGGRYFLPSAISAEPEMDEDEYSGLYNEQAVDLDEYDWEVA